MKRVAMLFGIGLALVVMGVKAPKPIHPPHKPGAIVRLYMGDGKCSGTVIAPALVLTAAHCVFEINPIVGVATIAHHIEIRAEDDKETGIFTEVVGVDPTSDLALLRGDVSGFEQMQVETRPLELNQSYLSGDKILACGYPLGGDFACSEMKKAARCSFQFCSDGFLYRGMSGGPVIDERTGKVIGVNTAVTSEGLSVLSPLVELWKDLHVEKH